METDLKSHYQILDKLQHLLNVKSDIDAQYSKSNKLLSESFLKLVTKTPNTHLGHLIAALERNLRNISNNLGQMAYDLSTDLNIAFGEGVKETKKAINSLKGVLSKVYTLLEN